MKSPSSLALASLIAASFALVGCADRTSLGPTGPRADEVLASSEETAVDSEVVIFPSDGPDVSAEGNGFTTMAVPAARPIRIGVVQSAGTINLGSAVTYEIRDKANSLLLVTGAAGTTAAVTLVSAPPSFLRLQVMCSSSLAAVATRKAAAEALGHPTLTQFNATANCTRLYVGQLPTTASTTIRNDYKNLLISQGIAQSDAFYAVVSVGGTSTIYRIVRGGTTLQNVNPVVVTASSGLITINGATYRGKGEARVTLAGTLAGINELPLEQYLYGVVPRELPPDPYGAPEAQKAQAVAARTYAMRGYNKRGADGYDLRATTDDQVYGGYGAEQPVSSAAVDATAGVVATYNGDLIDALFSSTSGGQTAASEEAFGAAPYLKSVPDAERGAALEHVPSLEVFKAHANPTSLRAAGAADFEADWSRYHRWTFEWTNAEITQVLSLAFGPVGRVYEINVLERGPSGRALKVQYVTQNGTFTSGKDGSTRSTLKYIDANGVPASLLSTLFFIEPVIDPSTRETTGFRAYGGGWGHGVGLAQTGAVGMAEKGYTYDQILKHYYQGIELTEPSGAAVAAVP